ncbi:MAG: hypothetical protein LAN18_06220 [Acidobacteriia bacterium]|nr:hypothetical protein [Terriglobia bacterium]
MATKLRPEWLTAIFTGMIACSGIAALGYAHWQISAAHKEAQVQHLLTLNKEFEDEPMVAYRKIYAEKRLKGVDDSPEEEKVLDFLETVALLTNRGYLTDKDVWETWSYQIFCTYAAAREMIEQDQKDDPSEYANLVSLVKRLESMETESHGTESRPSKEDLKDFWRYESMIVKGTPKAQHKHSTAKP